MNLTVDQIRELRKSPKNAAHIAAAKRDNLWQSFHAKPSTDKSEVDYYNTFIKKVRDTLDNERKSKLFEIILSFPLPSTQIISKASDEWNKIFTAQDRTIEYYFDDASLSDDFTKYLEQIGVNDVIEQNIFTAFKQSINTFVVIDLPERVIDFVNEGEYDGGSLSVDPVVHGDPNFLSPYVYLLDVSSVIDAHDNEKGEVEYIIFEAGSSENKKTVCIDGGHYRVFSNMDNEPDIEEPHAIGYCPVRTIWSDNISNDIPIRRFNAVIEALSELDEYVQYHVFARHTHLYAGFPVVFRFVSQCKYTDEEQNSCNKGIVSYRDASGKAAIKECPVCAKSSALMGPGSMATIPMPTDKETPMLPGEPIGFITPSVSILDYNKNIVKEKEARISNMLTGGQLKVTDKDAINEDQVRSQYETKQDVLVNLSENFQKIHKFIVDTIGRVRYQDRYQGSTINYGFNFFLIDMNIAVKEYDDAVKAGLPQYILSEKRAAVESIYVRNSPERLERVRLLKMLEPYLDVSIDKLNQESFEYELKANFSKYIDIFESEFGNITLFGLNVSLYKRIQRIGSILKGYVETSKNESQEFLRKYGQREEISSDGRGASGSNSSSTENAKDRV